MNKSILTTVDLKKSYSSSAGDLHVLKGIDLEITEGDIAVIMGPSGVGKSTLLHLIGGLDKPSSGTIKIDNTNLFELKNDKLAKFRNQSIGFIFQFHHLLPEFTALENVMIPVLISGKQIDQAREHSIALLKDVGLSERLGHKPNQLSGGEQQRVAFARALVNKPRLILADEPTGNLDKKNSQALYELMIEFNKTHHQTFIIVTHNEMMARKANRYIELEDGMIKNHSEQPA